MVRLTKYSTSNGQKRLMAESVGMDSEHWIGRPVRSAAGDYGCDPLGDGMFRMVPSGDVVDYTERCRRLQPKSALSIEES